MPTYEYVCKQCGRFEFYQGISERPLATCPTCHGPVSRLISAGAGFLFKGTGFYTTDYRPAAYKEQAKAEAGAGAGGGKDGKADQKESKPAAKSEGGGTGGTGGNEATGTSKGGDRGA